MSREYFERIAILGQYILNRVNEFRPDVSVEDNMESAVTLGPNPYRPEIADDGSLLIEFSYGLPSRFYTPLGSFDFCGEGVIKEGKGEVGARIASELISRFNLKEVSPAGKNGKKHIGPILSVGNDLSGRSFTIPDISSLPEGRPYEDGFIDFEERVRIWNEIKPDLQYVRQQAKEVSFEA